MREGGSELTATLGKYSTCGLIRNIRLVVNIHCYQLCAPSDSTLNCSSLTTLGAGLLSSVGIRPVVSMYVPARGKQNFSTSIKYLLCC